MSLVRAGNIVAYRSGERVICHRVLAILEVSGRKKFLMKGDWNPTSDGWIDERQIVGKVVRVNGRGLDSPLASLASKAWLLYSRSQNAMALVVTWLRRRRTY